MPSRRYTIVIADRTTGVVRRVTISLGIAALAATTIVVIPILIGLGAKWSGTVELSQLRASHDALLVENTNFRETTGELTGQIQSLEGVIDELGARSALDPAQAKAMSRLPAVVRARAAGGTTPADRKRPVRAGLGCHPRADGGQTIVSARPLRLTFDWLTIAETVTLIVLLVNLVAGHDKGLTSTVGPIHGILYITVIIVALLIPKLPNRIRLIAAIPAIGAPLAAWLMRRP